VWSWAASQPGGLIKSGVQGNTAAFAHFDFAAPLAVFCARGSPCRHRPGGRLCLLVLTAKATQPCPDFSALRRVECHASEYLGTLSVVTALVVFVGLSIVHEETKQSEDHRIALLTSVDPRQRLRRISALDAEEGCSSTQLFEAEMKRAILSRAKRKGSAGGRHNTGAS